jgi:hypothetical protein
MLSKKQQRFARAKNLLEQYLFFMGYELTMGDAYRDPRVPYGHKNSTHRSRLAQDYNIWRDGKLLEGPTADAAFTIGHNFWDFIGGAKRIKGDLGHFSFKHNGVR